MAARRFLLLLALFAGHDAVACSCSRVQDVAAAFASSDDVFLARVQSAELAARAGDTTRKFVDEKATLVVLEVFKGAKKPGDLVTLQSRLGPGACERSVTNNPHWLDTVDTEGNEVDVEMSDVWLIYRPADTSNCGRSMPADSAEDDLKVLRKAAKPTRPDSAN